MHSAACPDNEPTTYAPLKSRRIPAVYSDVLPAAPELNRVQKMRAEGRTRLAIVNGTSVQFLRLSARCKAHPEWQPAWPACDYATPEDAEAAKQLWEAKCKIKPTEDTHA